VKGGDYVTDFDKDLDTEKVLAFVRRYKAVSIKETKEHFNVNSKSMRRAFARLWFQDKILLAPYRRAVYIIVNEHKRGAPNVKKLWTEGHNGRGASEEDKKRTFTAAEWEEIVKRIEADKEKRVTKISEDDDPDAEDLE
jgi:hypothetical protein